MKINRCSICLEENCNGKHKCNCETCKNLNKCFRFLRVTIRITNKCTQKCSHCCFESSPESEIMMSIDMAKDINKFLLSNNVLFINVMGGEFFCNPDWYEIIYILSSGIPYIRLVTNGDWTNNNDVKEKLKTFIEIRDKNSLSISISKDRWHTNKNVDKAVEFLSSLNCDFKVATEEETKEESVVPVGRGDIYNMYHFIARYCENPLYKYSFLIDEEGYIYKCPFGIWKYANIKDYLEGGFAQKFKEYNMNFYNIFIPNCKRCSRIAELVDGTEKFGKVIVNRN